MSALWEAAAAWPVHGLLAGGLVLLVGRLAVALSQRPARRAWFGTAAVVAALLAIPLSAMPSRLQVTIPSDPPVPKALEPAFVPDFGVGDLRTWGGEPEPTKAGTPMPHIEDAPAAVVMSEQVAPPAEVPEPTPAREPTDWAALTGWVYGLVAGFFLVRLLAGHWALARLWRRAQPAPDWADTLFRRLAACVCPRAQLRVSARPAGPVCFGVVRPRVLVPAAFLADGDGASLRAVFAHELAHLSRRDPLAGWLLGITRTVYFVFPWLSGLRREVRLAQECLADADAAPQGAGPAEYADLLIRMARSRPAPLGAAGARGPSSELYRRVTMLLRNPTDERRCPRRWALTVGGGLTAVAILAAGLSIQPRAAAAPAPEPPAKKEAEKKEADKKEPAKADPFQDMLDKLKKDLKDDPEAVKRLEEMFKQAQKPVGGDNRIPPPANPALPGFQPPALPPDFDKELEAAQEMLRQQMEMLQKQLQGGGAGGVRGFVIGPDGFRPLNPAAAGGKARLGITVERPNDVLTSQLDLPVGQGLVAVDVPAESVAGKAGIKPNDVLFEIAGKPVPSNFPEFQKLLADIKPDSTVDLVVVRKGKKETIKGVKLPEAKPVAELPGLAGPGALRAVPVPIGPLAPPSPPPLPPPPGRGLPAAGPGETTRVEQVNDAFTVFHAQNGIKLTIAGTKDGGVPKAESIEVDDNGKTTRAESIDKLPKEYQEMAKTALKAVK
jgi:beta-lactamase regulating signal transducer with metallopeptidase domain